VVPTRRIQKETAQALILMGAAQREKGDYPRALRSFQQQLEIARTLGDQIQVALAQQGIGTVLEGAGALARRITVLPRSIRPPPNSPATS